MIKKSKQAKQTKVKPTRTEAQLMRSVMNINMSLIRPSLILSVATQDIIDLEGDLIKKGELYFNHKELLGDYQPLSRRTIDKVFQEKIDKKLYNDETKEELFGFCAALMTLSPTL